MEVILGGIFLIVGFSLSLIIKPVSTLLRLSEPCVPIQVQRIRKDD